MEATVIQEFKGCEDGAIYPRQFKVGEKLTGDIARVAVDSGWARSTEAKKPDLAPGGEKSGSASPAAPVSRKKIARKFAATKSSR